MGAVNPFREPSTSSETYNRTEVELARIREAEETKRQKIAAQEKTKQASRDTIGHWLVRFVAIVALVIVAVAIHDAYVERVHAEHPVVGCVETAEVITNMNASRSCPNGGWIEHTSLNGSQVLVRCHCSPKPATSSESGLGAH